MSDPTKPDAEHSHHHGHDHGHGAHDHDHDHTCCGGHGHDHSHDAATGTKAGSGEVEWTRRFLLFLELLVLLLWAVFMVWFYASGRINHYLIGEGTFRIQVLIGGLILAVMGVFNWQMRAVAAGCGHDHAEGESCGHDHSHDHDHDHKHDHHDGDCGHDHHHGHDHEADGGEHHHHDGTPGGRGMALALLALSVTAAVAFTPDDFSDSYKKNMLTAYASRPVGPSGNSAAQRLTPEGSPAVAAAGGITLEVIEKYQPRNKAGNFDLDVMQLYYSGSDPEYARVMKGQGVETVGQVVKDTANPGPGRWRVFVLQMTCCAADARPYSLPVEFEGAGPALQEMGWYRLTGKIDYVEEKGVTTAVLKAGAAEPTLRPKEQRTLF